MLALLLVPPARAEVPDSSSAKSPPLALRMGTQLVNAVFPVETEADEAMRLQARPARARARDAAVALVESWLREEAPDWRGGVPPTGLELRLIARWLEAGARANMSMPAGRKLAYFQARIDTDKACEAGGLTMPGTPVLLDALMESLRDMSAAQRQEYFDDVVAWFLAMSRIDDAPAAAPQPNALERALQAGARALRDPDTAPLQMPPRVATYVRARMSATLPSDDDVQRAECELAGWWAAAVMLEPEAERREDIDAFVYFVATYSARTFAELLISSHAAFSPTNRYPIVAVGFGITGATTVDVIVDGEGHPQSARIVERSVDVPGLPKGRRSVVFEDVFDEAALASVMGHDYPRSAAPGMTSPLRIRLAWKRERPGEDTRARSSEEDLLPP
jgi:hypothetical protein